jgi:hypothetical protein
MINISIMCKWMRIGYKIVYKLTWNNSYYKTILSSLPLIVCLTVTLLQLNMLLELQFHWIGTRFDSYREPSYSVNFVLGFLDDIDF